MDKSTADTAVTLQSLAFAGERYSKFCDDIVKQVEANPALKIKLIRLGVVFTIMDYMVNCPLDRFGCEFYAMLNDDFDELCKLTPEYIAPIVKDAANTAEFAPANIKELMVGYMDYYGTHKNTNPAVDDTN